MPDRPPQGNFNLWSNQTMNLTVPIPEQAATALAGLAKARGQTPEQIVATLVEHYLEDAEDLADALEALDDGETPIPLEQVKRELGF
jgi:predicted DNA-binding protein